MEVTKITYLPEADTPAESGVTKKQFYDEINYYRAEKMTQKMLESGLITDDERNRIMGEARKIFVPYLAAIL